MSRKIRRILISNDDGISGPGLECMISALKVLGRVYVAVPERTRSASSHAITLHRPVCCDEVKKDVFVINGTPADCVRFAVLHIMEEKVDLIASGINNGPNIGDDCIYSGTVAAATEGTMLGIPSFAVSLVLTGRYNFDIASKFTRKVAKYILRYKLPEGVCLNINAPDIPTKELKGVEITRQGKRIYDKLIEQRIDPRGRKYYWLGGEKVSGHNIRGTDIYAISRKKISVTPLNIDMTAYDFIDKLKRDRYF